MTVKQTVKRMARLPMLGRWMASVLLVLLALGAWGAPVAQAATIVVNTVADEYGAGAGCSLREAIQSANDDADFGGCTGASAYGADVITLPAGTYTLTGAPGEDLNATGDLDIYGILTINGAGSETTIVQAGTSSPVGGGTCTDCVDRVVHIPVFPYPTVVEMNGVTVRYGRTPDGGLSQDGGCGGGISNNENLTLNDCQVLWNRTGNGGGTSIGTGRSGGHGGGICSFGVLVLNNTSVTYNQTGAGGPGPSGGWGGIGGRGGGIYVAYDFAVDELLLNNATVSHNVTGPGGSGGDYTHFNAGNGGEGGPGGGIYLYTSHAVVIRSAIYRNATGAGGAGGSVTSGNGDGGAGGRGGSGAGVYEGSWITPDLFNREDGGPGAGGARSRSSASPPGVVLVDSLIGDNETGAGGSGGTGSGTGSGGAEGDRGDGGGLFLGKGAHTLSGSTLTENKGLDGGGIYSTDGAATSMNNCTLSENRAYGSGGGIYSSSSAGSMELTFVTVARGTADYDNNTEGGGGGIAGSQITMTNSIVAKNSDKGFENPDCDATFVSGDYNLLGVGDSTGCTFTPQAHDQVGTTASPIDPLLGILGDQGGPTWVHSLKGSSPAVDQIPDGTNGCVLGAVDQRGWHRFPPCDIGAYEIYTGVHVYLPLVVRGD